MAAQTIAIIGAGNMGTAILNGIHRHFRVVVCEQDQSRVRQIKKKYKVRVQDLETAVQSAQVLILATKPQDFTDLLAAIKRFCVGRRSAPLVISIAAGITCAYIEKRLWSNGHVVRTMPNLPAQLGLAMTAICRGKHATERDRRLVMTIFGFIGETVVLEEKWMDAVTAVSGSGPAYVFGFVEGLEAAATSLGLKSEVAGKLVLQTLKGSLAMLEGKGADAGALRQRVTSKGGTTQAALNVLAQQKVALTYKMALKAARQRARELAQ